MFLLIERPQLARYFDIRPAERSPGKHWIEMAALSLVWLVLPIIPSADGSSTSAEIRGKFDKTHVPKASMQRSLTKVKMFGLQRLRKGAIRLRFALLTSSDACPGASKIPSSCTFARRGSHCASTSDPSYQQPHEELHQLPSIVVREPNSPLATSAPKWTNPARIRPRFRRRTRMLSRGCRI